MNIPSKLPQVGSSIFTKMSVLAKEHNAINLSQGFPNFDCSQELKDLVTFYMNEGHNQYAPMAGVQKLREKIAQKSQQLYGATINPDTEITITAGATEAIFTTIAAFVKQGDEVILIEPAFDCYRPAILLAGGHPIAYELSAPDYKIDWSGFQKFISPRTRMIIFNTPHNPTGTIWKQEDLEQLEKLTAGSDIIVLSDEVYEHLVFDGEIHQSVLRFPELQQRSIVTNSFGKTYHCTGWRAGYCIAPEILMKEFRKVHQYNVFSIFTPLQYALADFLEKESHYLDLPDFFQQKRDCFFNMLSKTRFKPLPCEGTYFQLADYSEISTLPDIEFAKQLVTEHGIAVIPISGFYQSRKDEKIVRFCFAKTEETLSEAGKLLKTI